MKQRLLIAILFATAFCQAQIVNIPDANFKAKLVAASPSNFIASAADPIYMPIYNNWSNGTPGTVDTNGDGQIQVSEAQAIKCLNITSANIANLTGIEAFTNLRSLRVDNNALTSLNVTQNTALINLRCELNQLTSLTVGTNTSLLDLHCYQNFLTTLDLSQASALTKLYCNKNNLTSLNVTQCAALQILHCEYNALTSLNLSQSAALTKLHCPLNSLTTLNLSGCTALQFLDCFFNNLTSLDLSNSPSLTYLRCEDNALTSLNISQCTALTHIECENNQLTALDVTPFTALEWLFCYNNHLTSLDISQCLPLNRLSCRQNNLTVLNLKNGNPAWTVLDFFPNPNLQYICADEEDIATVASWVSEYPNCHVNTYCTFTPGGVYYEIEGGAVFDYNNNGCEATDLPYSNLNYTIATGSATGTLIADHTGNYYIPVGAGNFTIAPVLENPTYFNISPANLTVAFPAQPSPVLQHFCVTANGVHHDLEVVVVAVNAARPGFDAKYKIVCKNKGNRMGNGTISLTYNDAVLDLISANPIAGNASSGSLNWDFSNLPPFGTIEIELTFNVNSPTESPAVNINDVLHYTASVAVLNTDDTPADNTFTLNQNVVGSYDPNDKTCLEGNRIVPAMVGKYVHYLIRFENTGTYPAENILVKDIIDTAKFDITSLRPLDSSHEFVTRIDGNKVEFIFEGINLPFDDAHNDGYIAFKIKTKPNLTLGSSFSNSAAIYFDYNYPIVTNNYTTTVQALELHENVSGQALVAYPNPVKDILTFQIDGTISKVAVYDVAGRVLFNAPVSDNKVDLSELKAGNYLVKVYTVNGIKSSKIVKQ